MDTPNNKTNLSVSTALTAGAIGAGIYYNYGNGSNIKHLAGYIKETNQPYSTEVNTFSPYNTLKEGDIKKALKNIDELEPEVSSNFHKAIDHYKKIEKSQFKTGLASIFSKGLKKSKGQTKQNIKNNFSQTFKDYMHNFYVASSFNDTDVLKTASNLNKAVKIKTTLVGLLTTWATYQVLNHIQRGKNDH